MPQENNNDLFAISGRDLTYLVQQQERMCKSNLFEKYLASEDYKLVAKNVYRKGADEEIKLFTNYGEQRYINNNNPADTGNITQFIMNRLNENGNVSVTNDLVHFCLAVEKCLDFENDLLAQKKTLKNPRIVKENPSNKRKL